MPAVPSVPPTAIGNWAAFNALSEQVRVFAGLAHTEDYIENAVASQLFSFDENGMYRDPNEPMVYDLVTRVQLSALLFFGYRGKHRQRLDGLLEKGGMLTLLMQSTTGEIPFGGRSNQFLHNETFYAALCEFYADFFKKRGNMKKAGQFKRAARIAVESILPWLQAEPIRHIKNFYPTDSMYGCEGYAYYDKYMVTAGSWLYLAYALADDTIPEVAAPVESENYICETAPHFHLTMLKFGDYFAQLDNAAGPKYDASGIGRVQKKGAPPAICLSMPFSAHPKYEIDIENPSPLSICAVDNAVSYEITSKELTDDYVKVEFSNGIIKQTCIVSEKGIEFKAENDGIVEIAFPMFSFDGENETKRTVSGNRAEVEYKGWKCIYTYDGEITEGDVYANRNGHYIRMTVKGEDLVTLKIEIKEQEK